MSCNNSSSGCGCGSSAIQTKITASRSFSKLTVCNWLSDLPKSINDTNLIEIRFKNTRKEYFVNINDLSLKQGDMVAVEASPGHDIGMVSLTGELVKNQIRKHNISLKSEFKKIYRKVKDSDLEKWEEVISLEHSVMIEARKIALDLKLEMKIGDVEFQGDKTKAIFYYIADERVDFRELIKVLAERFRIRIEMKQIGARQEAGRIGGIASCGRELCCSTWMTNFASVTTNAARYQELSLNPQKLAGQCGKLKCCLNFELDIYLDAQENFPSKDIPLRTQAGLFYHQKTDVFKQIMWYSSARDSSINSVPLPVKLVNEIIEKNKEGIEVPEIVADFEEKKAKKIGYTNVVGQESLTRFDEKKRPKRNRRAKNREMVEKYRGKLNKPNRSNDRSLNKPNRKPKQQNNEGDLRNKQDQNQDSRDNTRTKNTERRRPNRNPRNSDKVDNRRDSSNNKNENKQEDNNKPRNYRKPRRNNRRDKE